MWESIATGSRSGYVSGSSSGGLGNNSMAWGLGKLGQGGEEEDDDVVEVLDGPFTTRPSAMKGEEQELQMALQESRREFLGKRKRVEEPKKREVELIVID